MRTTPKDYCRNFARGHCARGESCQFLHAVPDTAASRLAAAAGAAMPAAGVGIPAAFRAPPPANGTLGSSGGFGGKGGPPLSKPGDWQCPSCGDLVFARNANCRRCGGARPSAEPQGACAGMPWFAERGDWKCPGCGDLQFKRNANCRRCNMLRPAEDSGACTSGLVEGPQLPPNKQAKPGDWNCPGCSDLQFARNLRCRRCGTLRPADAGGGAVMMPSYAEPGDWLCPGCGDLQFKRNPTCRKCSTPRPAEAVVPAAASSTQAVSVDAMSTATNTMCGSMGMGALGMMMPGNYSAYGMAQYEQAMANYQQISMAMFQGQMASMGQSQASGQTEEQPQAQTQPQLSLADIANLQATQFQAQAGGQAQTQPQASFPDATNLQAAQAPAVTASSAPPLAAPSAVLAAQAPAVPASSAPPLAAPSAVLAAQAQAVPASSTPPLAAPSAVLAAQAPVAPALATHPLAAPSAALAAPAAPVAPAVATPTLAAPSAALAAPAANPMPTVPALGTPALAAAGATSDPPAAAATPTVPAPGAPPLAAPSPISASATPSAGSASWGSVPLSVAARLGQTVQVKNVPVSLPMENLAMILTGMFGTVCDHCSGIDVATKRPFAIVEFAEPVATAKALAASTVQFGGQTLEITPSSCVVTKSTTTDLESASAAAATAPAALATTAPEAATVAVGSGATPGATAALPAAVLSHSGLVGPNGTNVGSGAAGFLPGAPQLGSTTSGALRFDCMQGMTALEVARSAVTSAGCVGGGIGSGGDAGGCGVAAGVAGIAMSPSLGSSACNGNQAVVAACSGAPTGIVGMGYGMGNCGVGSFGAGSCNIGGGAMGCAMGSSIHGATVGTMNTNGIVGGMLGGCMGGYNGAALSQLSPCISASPNAADVLMGRSSAAASGFGSAFGCGGSDAGSVNLAHTLAHPMAGVTGASLGGPCVGHVGNGDVGAGIMVGPSCGGMVAMGHGCMAGVGNLGGGTCGINGLMGVPGGTINGGSVQAAGAFCGGCGAASGDARSRSPRRIA
eukprot:TRINITY_DN22196_c0_g2_i2.p1 TRINITY_DN22196_c0_g2~~TRINITY_DN22196_c0_g2_i2.p1  ORF type:complete len:1021 (+),score=165.45 TRINITY_DN22196_c0_g2_i2:183-3245(+)